MRIKPKIVLISLVTSMMGSNLMAYETPTSGMVYNTSESSALVFQCTKESSTFIDCQFTQTSVRKKLENKKLSSTVATEMSQFKNAVKECNGEINETLDILEGRKEPPIKDSISKMSDLQKKDMLSISRAFSDFCKVKTENAYEKAVYAINELETRTCSVSSNSFKQSFRLINDEINNTYSWVVDSTPTGSCGIVQLSRFEPVKLGNIIFWNYISRKAITNPKGKGFLNLSCGDLDQKEYLYDSSSHEQAMQCDYINFSVF